MRHLVVAAQRQRLDAHVGRVSVQLRRRRVHAMAVDGRGALWVGAGGFVVNALARYADGRWEATEARAGLPNDITVNVYGVSATGDVWIGFRGLGRGTNWRASTGPPGPWLREPRTWRYAVAPDGAMWASAIGRYDWKGLEDANPSLVPPLTPLVVASDGTVFAVDAARRLVRVAASSP